MKTTNRVFFFIFVEFLQWKKTFCYNQSTQHPFTATITMSKLSEILCGPGQITYRLIAPFFFFFHIFNYVQVLWVLKSHDYMLHILLINCSLYHCWQIFPFNPCIRGHMPFNLSISMAGNINLSNSKRFLLTGKLYSCYVCFICSYFNGGITSSITNLFALVFFFWCVLWVCI